MNREDAWPYVGHYLDNSLNVRRADEVPQPSDKVRLVGWQLGFEPMFVAVWSYLGGRLDDEEAVEIAMDYLQEIEWFGATPPYQPDYVL